MKHTCLHCQQARKDPLTYAQHWDLSLMIRICLFGLRFEPRSWSSGLKAGIWVLGLKFGPKAGIWASRLGLGPQGWDLGLEVPNWDEGEV